MKTYSDNRISALTNLFAYYVLIKWRFVAKNHTFFIVRIILRILCNWFLRFWFFCFVFFVVLSFRQSPILLFRTLLGNKLMVQCCNRSGFFLYRTWVFFYHFLYFFFLLSYNNLGLAKTTVVCLSGSTFFVNKIVGLLWKRHFIFRWCNRRSWVNIFFDQILVAVDEVWFLK